MFGAPRGIDRNRPESCPDEPPTPDLVQPPAAGLVIKTGPQDHTSKLTKHGEKPVLAKPKAPEAPEPHVPAASKVDYGKRKKPPAPRKANPVRKKAAPVEPASKRRRVSARDV